MLSEKILEGDLSETRIWGYKRNRCKLCLTWTCYFLSAFILRLVFHWFPRWYIFMSHSLCFVAEADVVLCKDQHQIYWIHEVMYSFKDGSKQKVTKFNLMDEYERDQVWRYFVHKKIKYIWNYETATFLKLKGLEEAQCSLFYQSMPLTEMEVQQKTSLYGENFIDVKLTPIILLLFREGLNPFYIFQICSCILWFLEQYTIFAICILIMSALSLSIELYELRTNETTLRKTVVTSGESLVCRDGQVTNKMDSREVVPGDIIEIPRSGCLMHCDAVLIAGTCIVNESMLTGESMPVSKTPLPNASGMAPFSLKITSPNTNTTFKDDELLDSKKHNRHILFCGTKVIQARNLNNAPIIGVVVRTGFLTAKGELVRSILFPKPMDIKFNKDAMKFVLVLFLFSIIGLVYTVIIMVRRNINVWKIILRSLDLITIVVPPSLPIAMTVGIVYAQSRLKKKSIFCISPNTINICGGINVTCFDKTGTLTEDGLDLWGVVTSNKDGTFDKPISEPQDLPECHLIKSMATCHSLNFIDGDLCGDPIDLKMFLSTNWKLRETEDGEDNGFEMSVPMIAHRNISNDKGYQQYSIGILRQFPFSSSFQRMAVITKLSNNSNYFVYVKGSPETMSSLCIEKTLPRDFSSKLLEFTRQGYRVLAMAYKAMEITYAKAMIISRHEVECDLEFLGFLVMENRLKPETQMVIKELKDANIRPVMITGDNILTAISVSRDCGIIEDADEMIIVDARLSSDNVGVVVEFHYAEDLQRHFQEISVVKDERKKDSPVIINISNLSKFHIALSGRTWSIITKYCPQLIPKLIVKGSVFARFAPDQKAQVIEALQSVGYYVSMCGDGANDCGALKIAHAGISLSEAEASVASPFTSKIQNISCVPQLIKEGRCAVTTSFGTFKFMAGYSFTQFISVLILYWVNANLGDYQFLYIDLIILTSLSLTYGYTKAYDSLSEETPSVRLLTGPMILSLVSQWTLNSAIQVAAYMYMYTQPWYYVPKNESNQLIRRIYSVTTVFIVSIFQYIILAVVFSKGPPFRSRLFTNYIFLFNIIVLLLLSIYIALKPFLWLSNLLELVSFPNLWINGMLFYFVVANFVLAYIIEFVIDDKSLRQQMHRMKVALFRQTVKYFEYERIKEEIDTDPTSWPPFIKSASVQDMRPEIFIDAFTMNDAQSVQYVDNDKERDLTSTEEMSHYEINVDETLPLHSSVRSNDTNLKIN